MLIHPKTKAEINTYLQTQAHAVLLVGPPGVGKFYVAGWVSQQLLGLKDNEPDKHPYFFRVGPINNSIGIDEIRQIGAFLRLKTLGKQADIRRVIVIEDAHYLTIEAQNSLLKNLEEPPADTVLILTAVDSKSLLPTIYSRVQQIEVKPVSPEQANQFFKPKTKEEDINQSYLLSGGKAGLLSALLTHDDHPLIGYINQAKHLLRQSAYERLIELGALSTDKEVLRGVIGALKQIALAGIKQAVENKEQPEARRWHNILSASDKAEEKLALSVNTKLLMTDLFINM